MCRRTTHDVPLETICHMLNKYERVVSIQSILGPQFKFKQSHLLKNECSKYVLLVCVVVIVLAVVYLNSQCSVLLFY